MASMPPGKGQRSVNPDLPSRRRSHLSDDFKRKEVTFPTPYVIPNLQYVNTTTPPFSTEERPFVCTASELMKLDHLHNPMIVFGQPFAGKTCLFMKLTAQGLAYYGHKHWTRMIDLRMAALNCISTGKWPTDIIELLAGQLGMSGASLRDLFRPLHNAKELIRKKKYDKLIRGELFLDGFDEIPIPEREYFLKLIPQLKFKRQDCPIRIWISCRSYFKGRLLKVLGDESAFEIQDYDVDLQKSLLFYRWKDRLSEKKLKKYEENRLWEYTHVMYDEFCKEIKNFQTTLGTSPLYLEVISSIFANHANNFITLYRKLRQDQKAGPNGDGHLLSSVKDETTNSTKREPSETSTAGKGKKKKKKFASSGNTEKKGATAATTPVTPGGENDDAVNAPTTQLMCQIAGMFTAEFFEFLVYTAVDVHCLKYLYKDDVAEDQYQAMLEREYRRVTHLYAQYAIRTFPSFQYESLVPSTDDPNELVHNLQLLVDEELHHIGFLIMDGKNHVVQLRNKLIGYFFLAKHFACMDNMRVRDPEFDKFYLRVFLFDGEAKLARSIYDNILHFSMEKYRPEILREFLLKQYKLDDEEEWEQIRDTGSVWHLAVMEGYHCTAMTMVKCFHPINEREQIRRLLRIRVPLEIYEGGRSSPTVCRVAGTKLNQRHLVSAFSLVAMFAYSDVMKELLKTLVTFYTPEEIQEEFCRPDSFTPIHYAAMHSNLWFIMYMYDDVFIPIKIQPPPGIYNPNGQLPTHLLMSYSWYHIMILRDYLIPEYDTLEGSSCTERTKTFPTCTCSELGKNTEDAKGVATTCCDNPDHASEKDETSSDMAADSSSSESSDCDCKKFREVICYRDMIKELHGPGNLLRVTHHECIRLLVRFGREDLDASERLTGNTMLHYATIDGCLETVKYLLNEGAMIEAKNKDGKTPLHYAGMYGHRQVFMCLVKRGGKATAQDSDGLTPISMWTRFGARIDKNKNLPMSKEDSHFFKACEDIDKIMQEQALVKAAEEEAAEQMRRSGRIGLGNDVVNGSVPTEDVEEPTSPSIEHLENNVEEIELEDKNNNNARDEDDEERTSEDESNDVQSNEDDVEDHEEEL